MNMDTLAFFVSSQVSSMFGFNSKRSWAEMLRFTNGAFPLRDTLPVTIQDLRLYGYEGTTLFSTFPTKCMSHYPGSSTEINHTRGGGSTRLVIKERYLRLEEVCSEKGIILQIEKRDWLPKGGNCNGFMGRTPVLAKRRLSASSGGF